MARLESFTDKVHLDIADGVFVPNKTVDGFEEILTVPKHIRTGVHLMVSRPEDVIDRWLETDAVEYIIHVESSEDLNSVVEKLKSRGRRVILALNPGTPWLKVSPYLEKIDGVQFMTVKPGFYGSKFEPQVVEVMHQFHNAYPDVAIYIDGAVSPATAPELVLAGASVLISGSFILNSPDVGKAIDELRKIGEN